MPVRPHDFLTLLLFVVITVLVGRAISHAESQKEIPTKKRDFPNRR
ncbi:MAG: hypothetical protein J0H02_07240 [Armatimonadetes bacterium]|nr:hypothetical protein [Armatimonadota bacterium]